MLVRVRQSITALAHLRAAVLYIVDISEQCGFTIAQQVAALALDMCYVLVYSCRRRSSSWQCPLQWCIL